MFYLPRRFAVAFAVVISLLMAVSVDTALAQTVRKSITALTPAELMSLRTGVAVMKSRDTAPRDSANFRRSWVFWANMHGHFGDDCRGPIVGNGMTGLALWIAAYPAETATWCKCEHGTSEFLAWHRMYLYYFEQVLRQAANDPALTLPYWDTITDAKLPAALRDKTYKNAKGKSVKNPLRVEQRRTALNNGTASLATAVTSPANAMAAITRADFEKRLEATPHGSVHCAIATGGCPNGLMGAVPVAALDPVFYLHHANIDRLYECWLTVDQAGRLPIDPAILEQKYSFVDGDGNLVERQVSDMLTLAQLGYGYEGGAGCPPPAPPPVASATLVAQAAPASKADATTTAQAAPMAGMKKMAGTELKRGITVLPLDVESVPASYAAPKSAVVVIEGVNATVVPGVLYNVYLANPSGQRSQVGLIDFFGFGGPPAGGKHDHGAAKGKTFEFDATAAVKTLGITGARKPSLIFEPTTGLTDSTVATAMQSIPSNAKVTFKSARLRLQR